MHSYKDPIGDCINYTDHKVLLMLLSRFKYPDVLVTTPSTALILTVTERGARGAETLATPPMAR